MCAADQPYYRPDLALVHERGFGLHAVACAPGILEFLASPSPDRFVREITTFVPTGHGAWRRDLESHENVLIDTARIPDLLGANGVEARVELSFGAEKLPPGARDAA